jgi:hypothetical protein
VELKDAVECVLNDVDAQIEVVQHEVVPTHGTPAIERAHQEPNEVKEDQQLQTDGEVEPVDLAGDLPPSNAH